MRRAAIYVFGFIAATLPTPLNAGDINVRLFGQSLEGKPVYVFESDAHDISSHTNSGGYSGLSADGQYLQVYKTVTQNQGVWYAAKVSDRSLVALMSREDSGDVNQNVVWAPTGSDFFRLRRGNLERWAIGGAAPIQSVRLPTRLSHHSGRTANILSYRLQVGSGRTNPALIVYASGYDETALMPFDPDTLAQSPHWWIVSAMSAGVANGTAVGMPKKLSNVVPMGSGYAGIHQESERGHWIPQNGSTAIAIEPDLPKRYHPAFRGSVAIFGESATAEIVCAKWGDPPQAGQANETELWRLDKPSLLPLFPGQSNPNQIALHHVDIGNKYAAISMLDNSGPEAHKDSVLIKVRLSDGQVTPIMSGLFRDARPGRRFVDAARPTISWTDDHIAYTLPIDGKTKLFLVEL